MTEYKRYQGKSYMVWSGEKSAKGYEVPMLTKNKIQGLLAMQITESGGNMQYWYDISGRQSLTDRASVRTLDCTFLRRFLQSLIDTVERCGTYLLSDEGICLDAEHIFVDSEGFAFCYRPFAKRDFTESLCEFMEYYLSHMEHGDREGAQRCYDVYETCREGNVKMENLLLILNRMEKQEESRQDAAPCQEEERKDHAPHVAKTSWPNKKKSVFSKMKKYKKDFGWQKKSARNGYVFEPEDYREQTTNPTVFLGSETEEILGELKYEGEESGRNLQITKPVYLIGSKEDEVDGYICDDTVSRVHARMTREENGYYLEDLNSTNGTSRNGEALNYREKVLLEKNDRIVFAKVRYRFV